jgi:integrase
MLNQMIVATTSQTNAVWEQLANCTVSDSVSSFLSTLSAPTQRSYKAAFNSIFEIWEQRGIFSRNSSLQALALSNLENLLDCIETYLNGSLSTRQSRCSAFIAFTKYMDRATGGIIRPAKPRKGANGTFKRIRDKGSTKAFSHEDWGKFSKALKEISHRDYLIAKAIFQGAKRCSEVLLCEIPSIDWENSRIEYKQLKSNVFEKKTVITYNHEFMKELKDYIGERKEGVIFVTRTGHPVTQPHLHRSFSAASVRAGLAVRVHPHMLRASAITLFMKMGYHSDQIIKVSGHSNTSLVLYYDRSSIEDNLTQQASLL